MPSSPSTLSLYRYQLSPEFSFLAIVPGYIFYQRAYVGGGGKGGSTLITWRFISLLKCDNGYIQIISREEKQHSFGRRN